MSVEQRLSELQSKAQAVANECHRLGLLINSVGSVGRPIVNWLYKASNDSGWWRVFSFTPTGGIYNTSVVHISAFSSTSGLVDRAHWELILSGVPNGDPTYSSAYLQASGVIKADSFQLRYDTSTGTYTLFFYIPQFTDYGLYITFPKAPCPYSLYNSAMEPTGSVNIPVKYANAPVPLWSGSWSSGGIVVPEINYYTILRILTTYSSLPLIAIRRDSEIVATGTVPGSNGNHTLSIRISSITGAGSMTLNSSYGLYHTASSNHNAGQPLEIIEIYGVM